MKRLESIRALREWRRSVGDDVCFVPTMGALHEGHLTLVDQARAGGGPVVVSIFVNPTQFSDPADLERYPRTLEADLDLLEARGVSAVFFPRADEMYTDEYRYSVHEKEVSTVLCGPGRPGHFDGMLTVVLKLLNLVRPRRAFFGEKDFQQLRLIQGMAAAFFLETEIVPGRTVREADGLAMSSRNQRLTAPEREMAPLIYHALKESRDVAEARRRLEDSGFRVDYVEEHWGRRFAAAYLGQVRLIDNVEL